MRAIYKVIPDGDRWAIKLEGEFTPLGILAHKNEAVKHARDLAERDMPSRLVVVSGSGRIESQHDFGVDQLERDVREMREMEEPMPEGLEPMPEMEEEV